MRDLEERLTAALADTARRNLPDGTTPPPLRRSAVTRESPGRIRSWAVPALAAAVVVALAVGVVVLTNRGQDDRSAAGPNRAVGTYVTLRARTKLSAAELEQARQVVIARAAALGASKAQVQVQVVRPDELTAYLPGVSAGDVTALGAIDALQLRPVVLNPITGPAPKASGTGAPVRIVDPWRSLGFPPPTDAAAYNALSPTQQTAVRAVLHGWNCANASPARPGAPIVACDQNRTGRYLLGPTIISSKDVRSARATAPTLGAFSWQVFVRLSAAGQRLWSDYTAKHNEGAHPGDQANVVATTVDGVVVVASTIEETINGDTSIAGDFTSLSATLLAANLTGGTLPAPFDVVSVQPR
jgi:preprotein translocase subunit SecD